MLDCHNACYAKIQQINPNWDKTYCCMFDTVNLRCYLDEDDGPTSDPGQTQYVSTTKTQNGCMQDNTGVNGNTCSAETLTSATNGQGQTWANFGVFHLPVDGGNTQITISDFFDNSDPSCTVDNTKCAFKSSSSSSCDTTIPYTGSTPSTINMLGTWIDSQTFQFDHSSFTGVVCVECSTSCCSTEQSVQIGIELNIRDSGFSSQSSPVIEAIIPYDSGITGHELTFDIFQDLMDFNSTVYDDYIDDISCALMDVGCLVALPITDDQIKVEYESSSTSWSIFAKKNVASGYSYSFCLKCDFISPGLTQTMYTQTVYIDNLNITQDSKQSTLQGIVGGTAKIDLILDPTLFTTFQWDDFYTNSNPTACPLDSFELHSYSAVKDTGCPNLVSGSTQTITNNIDNTITIWHDKDGAMFQRKYCFEARTVGGSCADSVVVFQQSFRFRDPSITLGLQASPPGDQTFNYNAVISPYVIGPTEGFEYFMTAPINIQDHVTCELLGNDCLSAPTGTQGDGVTSLSTGPHVTLDTRNPWPINCDQNVPTGYQYNVCLKCKFESMTPSNRVIQTFRCEHTFKITQKLDCTLEGILGGPTIIDLILDPTQSSTFQWDDFYTNSNPTACPLDSFELHSYGTVTDTGCPNLVSGSTQTITNNIDKTITIWHDKDGTSFQRKYCFEAKTVGGSCDDSVVVFEQIFMFSDQANILALQNQPPGDQTFNFNAVSSPYVIGSPGNGFEYFMTASINIKDSVTCELLGNDCLSAPIGTQGDGVTPLSTGPHVTLDTSNPWPINCDQNVPSGYQYSVCLKCKFESITPSNRIIQTIPCEHTFKITQQPDCNGVLFAKTQWITTYTLQNRMCLQQDKNRADYFVLNQNGWTDFFSNSKPTFCPIDSCSLAQNQNCGNSITQRNGKDVASLTFDKTTQQLFLGLDLQYTIDIPNICIICNVQGESEVVSKTGYMNVVNQMLEYDPFKFADFFADKVDIYDSNDNNQIIISNDYSSFFNKVQSFCKSITACELFDQDCLTPFASSSEVWMTSANEFGLRYFRNIPGGFDHQLCIKCWYNAKNPIDSSLIQNHTVTQLYRVTLVDCSLALSPNIGLPSYLNTNLSFDDQFTDHVDISEYLTNFNSWDDHFSNSNQDLCKITLCTLEKSKNEGISWEVSTPLDNVFMQDLEIKAKRNVVEGYQTLLKVQCQNDFNGTEFDARFVVTQSPKPIQEVVTGVNEDEFLSYLPTKSFDVCANEDEICECEFGNFIWYGAQDQQGQLDRSRNYTKVISQQPQTLCQNSTFKGISLLAGESKQCWCQNFITADLSPRFAYSLDMVEFTMDFEKPINQIEIQLPPIQDLDNDFKSIAIRSTVFGNFDNLGSSKNMEIDSDNLTFFIWIDSADYRNYVGFNHLIIKLEDGKRNSNEYFLTILINLPLTDYPKDFVASDEQVTSISSDEEQDSHPANIYLSVMPITYNGNTTILFSEGLKVPQSVSSLLDKRSERRIFQTDQNDNNFTFLSVNQTLDAYIKEALNLTLMQYHDEDQSYRDQSIDFEPHLHIWNEKGITF